MATALQYAIVLAAVAFATWHVGRAGWTAVRRLTGGAASGKCGNCFLSEGCAKKSVENLAATCGDHQTKPGASN